MTKELNTYLPVNSYDGVNPSCLRDRLMRRPVVEHIERYRWVLNDLRSRGADAWPLLEVGTGCGWGLKQIQTYFDELSVGIDLDISALSEGIQAGVRKVSQANLVAQNLPFVDEQFGTIVNLNLLEQLSDPLTGLINMNRVAKRNAQMYISIFNRDLFSPGGIKWFKPNEHEFSQNDLVKLLSESGWCAVEWLGQRFVSRKAYLKRATQLQSIENWLKKSEVLSKDRRVQIFRARVQNIIPSSNPSVAVKRLEERPSMEPVIITARCIKN